MVDETLIRRLASVRDEGGRPVFVSLFADLTDAQHGAKLERRAKEIEAAVADEDRPIFQRAWDAAKRAYEAEAARDGTRGIVVFSGPQHDVLEVVGLGAPVPTKLVADSSPYIRPLVAFLDDHEAFVLLLLDGQDAAVFLLRAGHAELKDSAETNLMRGHRSGGMSQARYQRHREGVLNQFLDQVAADVQAQMQELGVRRVIVAGPGQVKDAFMERAPHALRQFVLAVEDADLASGAADEVLAKKFLDRGVELAREQAKADLEALKTALKTDRPAVTGAFDCVVAAQSGRVAKLLVLRGHKVAAQKCERHQAVFQPGRTCPTCQHAGSTVDAINEAIEHVVQSNGDIEFVQEDTFLESIGGTGAILRF